MRRPEAPFGSAARIPLCKVDTGGGPTSERDCRFVLIRFVPKGPRDCGDHDWYKATDSEDHCYHCRVGVQRPSGDS